ncbi:MAG: SDR family oxidoreductase [Acidimicrobiia bacterium]|nr:SDR family oxidoreductase [Acidimicrobiia bacterium]
MAQQQQASLDGRSVLVTGGNGGIGLGLATGCARAGADLVIWGTNQDKLERARSELAGFGGQVVTQRIDVSDEEQVIAGFGVAVDRLGKVDAVFANAGVSGGGRFVDQTLDDWHQVLSVNLEGTFFTLREAARHMIDTGNGGSLIGVSSVSAIHGAPMAQPYAASKAAILAVMRGLAVELARYRIRCNTIVPGWTETEMTEAGRQDEKFLENTTYRTPIRRWGVPSDYAALGAFLADPTQMYHTGDEIVMDGGYTRF